MVAMLRESRDLSFTALIALRLWPGLRVGVVVHQRERRDGQGREDFQGNMPGEGKSLEGDSKATLISELVAPT